MPHPENVIGKGRLYSRDYQPANRGRKPRLYTLAKHGYNVGWDEFRDVMLYVMQMTKSELEALSKSDDAPVWVVNIARSIYQDANKGRLDALRELMDRAFGKVPQRNEVSLSATDDVSDLPTTALLQMHEIAQRARKEQPNEGNIPTESETTANANKTTKKRV